MGLMTNSYFCRNSIVQDEFFNNRENETLKFIIFVQKK